jgi:hypothetical protein
MRCMVRVLAVILAAFLAAALFGCKEKPAQNQVDLKQLDADGSTNYRHVFEVEIEKQKEEANKLKKNDFR